jgi:nicotinate dehydrogenase subunit B
VAQGTWQLIRALLLGLGVVLAVIVAGFLLSRHPAIEPLPDTAAPTFGPAQVARGESLAAVGNCVGCHTAERGRTLAGGRALRTPFGTIYSTNITPDRETGIGRWPLDAFWRAMREGIGLDGRHLYPAFPYDHFTHVVDADIDALYAYLMTRAPVRQSPPANQLKGPYGFRPLIEVWNRLYLEQSPMADDPSQSADWNRGRALAQVLAHCGACHTPRNEFGAEKPERAYDGAWTEGWYAPALNAHSPAVQPWTADELFAYLRTGVGKTHGAAAGPMGAVTRSLAQADEADVRAIAVYVASLMAEAPAAKSAPPPIDRPSPSGHDEAAQLFAGACAGCHEPGAPMMLEGRSPLPWGTPLHEDAPHDTIQILMHGLRSPAGRAGPVMPAFGSMLNNRQVANMAAYLRARFTDKPPWPDLEQVVAQVREKGE